MTKEVLDNLKIQREIKELAEQFPEFLDVFKIIIIGREKHGDSWLQPDGATMSKKDNHASLSRHLAKMFVGEELDESGYSHELHIACRALMSYTRKQRGLIHPADPKPVLKHQTKAPDHFGFNCIDINDHHEAMKTKANKFCKDGD